MRHAVSTTCAKCRLLGSIMQSGDDEGVESDETEVTHDGLTTLVTAAMTKQNIHRTLSPHLFFSHQQGWLLPCLRCIRAIRGHP